MNSDERFAEFKKVLDKGGLQCWPQWVIDSFQLFYESNESEWLIVLCTPPPSLFPDFKPCWVTQSILAGTVHAGHKVPTKKRGEPFLYRVSLVHTEPDPEGNYISGADFPEEWMSLRVEADAVIRESENRDDAQQRLLANLAAWEKCYKIKCMSGPSHTRFTHRTIMMVAAQPSLEAMRATLWQAGTLEMPVGIDAGRFNAAIAKQVQGSARRVGEKSPLTASTVSTMEIAEFPDLVEALNNTFKVLMERVWHYLSFTSNHSFPLSFDLATVCSEERKEFNKGPHRRRGNIGDSNVRLTPAGFGIGGAVFCMPLHNNWGVKTECIDETPVN
jgi:hypothetical protein